MEQDLALVRFYLFNQGVSCHFSQMKQLLNRIMGSGKNMELFSALSYERDVVGLLLDSVRLAMYNIIQPAVRPEIRNFSIVVNALSVT